MRLYGRDWTRREASERVGRIDQLAGAQRLTLADGPEAGVEAVAVRSGAGLDYLVLPSRGMDISLATFGGAALSWQGQPGAAHPAYFDARGGQWLRTAVGGLLMTCGPDQVGAACSDGGEELPVHGRAHHTPARQVAVESRWAGDQFEMRIAGVVEQARMFGEFLRLTREIRTRAGENAIRIRDQVENVGFADWPLMVLYHFNFGFPLLAEGTTVELPSRRVTPRDAGASADGCERWERPQAGVGERVYYHDDLETDADGRTAVTIRNPAFPLPGGGTCRLAVRLCWPAAQLPRFVQWKMTGQGMHVLGIEPANCHVAGRSAERAGGTLETLGPGQSRTFELELAVDVEGD